MRVAQSWGQWFVWRQPMRGGWQTLSGPYPTERAAMAALQQMLRRAA